MLSIPSKPFPNNLAFKISNKVHSPMPCTTTSTKSYFSKKTFNSSNLCERAIEGPPKIIRQFGFKDLIFLATANYLEANSILGFEKNLPGKGIFVCLLLSLACQLGDLIISYFKRLAKVKDTGKILPGHGGMLDRIDGIIFAIPSTLILQLLS